MPTLKNTDTRWGIPAILFHWITAVSVIGLFLLGWWMVDLTYYHEWYHEAPAIHKAVGILLFLVVAARLGWRLVNPIPRPAAGVKRPEAVVADIAHWMLYLLLFTTMLSGYLISTAEGDAISVFGLFDVPASITGIANQEDVMGEIHEILAWTIIAIASLHAAGALKHHFIDKDNTLKRMLGLAGGHK